MTSSAQASKISFPLTQTIPRFCRTEVTTDDLSLIREVIESTDLSRNELANTVCELMGWERPNGKLKTMEAVAWLIQPEKLGLFQLPALKNTSSRVSRSRVQLTQDGEPQPVVA
jgi:hypothetical protein